ncbi:hypothetical protein NRK67_16615 (plasmid) [Fusobacteria bacterium ZRK30]|nr:hypothetical protein NRK67_16615 [Fusobacteria bacterium ZRK30]
MKNKFRIKKNIHLIKFLVITILTTFLFGCTSYVNTRVTTFTKIPKNAQTKTYAFVPIENQENNLEYEMYKDYIRQKLSI